MTLNNALDYEIIEPRSFSKPRDIRSGSRNIANNLVGCVETNGTQTRGSNLDAVFELALRTQYTC